jgi:hypothetical protein
MPMPNMPNVLQRLFGAAPPAPKPQPRPMTDDERRAAETQAYLVQLSRNSPRGQEYARRADELRAMVQRARMTSDPGERRAIVQAMQNSQQFGE